MAYFDIKDQKLIYELDCNSRQTFQQLSRKVGLSKDTVKYRINKLIKKGVIKSFNAVIDTGKLGYLSFRLFLRIFNVSAKKENELISALLRNKNLIWLVKSEGKWNINTWFLYKSIDEFNNFLNEFLDKYKNFIDKKDFGIYSEVIYYGRSYLLDKNNSGFSNIVVSLPKIDSRIIDKTELKIIKVLSKDARISIIKLAKKLGLTSKTVINKIRKLEKDKIIVGYRTEFDLEKLGYNYYKIHINTFNLDQKRLMNLNHYIKNHKNIIYVDRVIGGYDIEIEVQFQNDRSLRKFLNEFKDNFSDIIKNYEILYYYKEYKLRFFPTL